MLSDTSSSENDASVRVSEGRCVVPRVHSHSQGEGVGAASFVHHDRFAELSGDDTVSVLPQEVFVPQAKNVGHHRRRRRARSEGSDPEHSTLIDSSDEDAPFLVPARPSRRLVLVPESADDTPQSVQDRARLDRGSNTVGELNRGDTLVSSDEEPLVPCSRNPPCAWGPQCQPAQELSWKQELTVSPRKNGHPLPLRAPPGASADQFRTCGLFAPSRSCHSDPIFHSGRVVGPPHRTHQGGVDSQLGTAEEGEAIHNNLKSSADGL